MKESRSTPPRWALRFFRWYCHPDFAEDIEGDLLEKFSKKTEEESIHSARRTFAMDVIRLFRPGIIRTDMVNQNFNNNGMVISYFHSAVRNFKKHISFTFLNTLGLSLGIAASLLIFQYVKYEKSYDTFHSNIENIYRVQYNIIQNGQLTVECAAAVPAVGPAMTNNFPEIQKFTRLYPIGGIVTYEDPIRGVISFREEKMQISDPSVFEIFDFQLLKGDPATSLKGLNKAVITEKAARKYFNDQDPIGKTIHVDGDMQFEVTGILKDIPANSHIKFEFLLSYETLNQRSNNNSETSWGWYDFNTYVLTDSKINLDDFQKKWNKYLQNERADFWHKHNFQQEFILKPAKDIHLYSNLLQESEPSEQGNAEAVYFLNIIAFFILFIAWINYVNLSTAKSFQRANEVGIRKVLGAVKGQLVKQFLVESLLINLLATLIAIGIVRLCWPAFTQLSGREIPLHYIIDSQFWLQVSVLFIIGTLLAGFYPALVLSSFKPITVLKGKIIRSQGNVIRKSLVVFQFAASIILITGTIIIYQQLHFMQTRDLGIDIDQTLVIEGPGVTDSLYDQNLESFKQEALRIAGVKQVTASTNIPGEEIFWTRGTKKVEGDNWITVYNVGIDYDYISAYGLKIIAGRNFDRNFPNDDQQVLINRQLAQSLEFGDPEKAIGQKLCLGRDTLEIAGVLDNYHQMSLKNKVQPLLFLLRNSDSYYSFKIAGENHEDVLTSLEEPWKTYFPDNPMDYFYLDSFFNKQYESDRQFGEVFGLFALLAIFIASLGLFGLSSFLTIQRTKEIGVRKVLGSTVFNIILLLSKGFIQLVIIANLIAWPLAWWVMNSWLESFTYRIDISPLLFLAAGFSVIVIAFLSVGFQTLKAAVANPVNSLRNE